MDELCQVCRRIEDVKHVESCENRSNKILIVGSFSADTSMQCDLQTPSCGRCLQLGKECVGSGVQRFKFQDQTTTLVINQGNRSRRGCAKLTMDKSPSNELTLLTAKTISILGIADMRYALAYHMGFLTVVPRRLGRNDTLDTAVRAMTVCFPAVCGQERSKDMFLSFGKALKKLRISLLDRDTSNSPEMLCAIYIVATCRVSLLHVSAFRTKLRK